MTRLLCTGDTHIGQRRDLAPDRLKEQEQIWRTTLEFARSEGVDAVLHLGDMWERRKPTPDEYLAAEWPLVEHRDQGGPPVLVVCGNHDRSGVDEQLALDVLARAGLITLAIEPQCFRLASGLFPDLAIPGGITIAALPWTPVSRLVAAQNGGDRDRIYEQAAELLLATARGLRAQVEGPAVLALHWAISGGLLSTGLPVDLVRETILPLDALEQLGFDAIIAGHIHRPQELATTPDEPMLPVFHVGSPMPLNFGEGNQEHGAWLLESHEAAPGVVGFAPTFIPVESRPFQTIALTGNDGIVECSGGFVKVRGPHDLDVAAARDAFLVAGAIQVFFELEPERKTRQRSETLAADLTDREQLAAYLEAQGGNGQMDVLLERAGRYLEMAP